MIQNNRIIYSDNGTNTDISVNMNRFQSGTATIAMVATEDYIYLGSDWKFNHRHIHVSSANAVASVASVELYDGSNWRAAVDVIDQTSVTGATLAQSGIISWVPDRSYSWNKIQSTESIAALSGFKIYDFYWARIKVSANLTAGTAIKYIGYKFSTDEDLGSYYPEFETTAFKAGFEASKTEWNEQHITAAEIIISDLIKKQKIVSRNQIMNWEKFTIPAIHAVASIVFRALGNDWSDKMQKAIEDYRDSFDMIAFDVDTNQNGMLDHGEKLVDLMVTRR